ncbi:hypothetical protein H074_36099 [Amycolatopsis decaplanina DSM 44594]|uniref:Uncharacterized protein n=1 Tax=Amycolatopsis decaplanina DSM 44594 TaxID=1284240 RepID=M2WSJ2_9PSEU|nr:hypothetical protein H074_36099 [Amycolatopsis decaplanina DSM 44594]
MDQIRIVQDPASGQRPTSVEFEDLDVPGSGAQMLLSDLSQRVTCADDDFDALWFGRQRETPPGLDQVDASESLSVCLTAALVQIEDLLVATLVAELLGRDAHQRVAGNDCVPAGDRRIGLIHGLVASLSGDRRGDDGSLGGLRSRRTNHQP